MRLSYCATTKGSRSNLQAAIKSPPARSSSQASNRVPLQSALKAIQSHQPLRPIELAFQLGDIFQVKGECVEPDGSVWLDVMSPVSGLRGIVPLQKFRIISLPKQSAHEHHHPSQSQLSQQQSHPSPQYASSDEKFLHSRSLQRIRKRLSSHSTLNLPLKSPPATLAENTTSDCPPGAFPFPSVDQSSPKPPPTRNRRSLTLSSAKLPAPPGYSSSPRMRFLSQSGQANPPASTQMPPVEANSPIQLTKPSQLLYGVVKHSFNPESDHELKAHAGEPIIINAYSELGWFVCKPISRLGGPGLLPVSHVQVRDVTTGTELSPENLEHFARSSGLPRVNEWEEATAAYLCRSIPLGSFESSVAPPTKEVLPTVTLSEPAKSLYTDPKKLMASSELVREWQLRQMEDTLIIEPQSGTRPSLAEPMAPRRASHGTFVMGTAECLTEAQGEFWFTLRVKFAYPNESELSMKTLVVRRSYEELLKFDQSLQSRLRIFSATIAEELQMPWLMEHVTANMVDHQFCSYQVDELNGYLGQLSQASLEIRELGEVHDFLGPRQSDLELEENMKSRLDEEAIFQYLDQMALASSIKYELPDNPAKSSPSASQSTFADQSTASPVFDNFSFNRHHSDPSSDYLPSTPSSTQLSTKFKACPSLLTKNPTKSYYNSDGQITKMKICHLQSDDVIAIKVSSSITLNDLTTKIRSRYNETCASSGLFGDDYFGDRTVRLKYLTVDSLDQSRIDFDDCESSADETDVVPPHLGPGTFVRITSDAQLRKWIDTQQKLVLYI